MNKIGSMFAKLGLFKWNLWIALCLIAIVPAVYQVVSTALVSSTASDEGIDILGQMEWFDLIDETLKAFLIVPLYALLNRIYKNSRESFGKAVFSFGWIVLVLYLLFSLGVFVYGKRMINYMNPNDVDIEAINNYLMLELLAFVIGIVPAFINVVFVTVGKSKNVYFFLIIRVILGMIGDFVLIPKMGVNGIAISNMITNFVLFVLGIIILAKEGLLDVTWVFSKKNGYIINWIRVGLFSGCQQFIDNIIYALMIGKMVNMVSEQGNYWVANNFIWGWLLIPITALAEIIKSDCKTNYKNLHQSNYYLITLFTIVVWVLSIPLWSGFYEKVQLLDNYKEITSITLKLLPFYFAYALCIIPDSIFVGFGVTILNTINSLIINLIYYGVWFILYLKNMVDFSINIIILMFGFGMVVHLAVSWLLQFIWGKRNKKIKKGEM